MMTFVSIVGWNIANVEKKMTDKQTEALKLALDALREIERLPGISSANLYAQRALKEMEALTEQPASGLNPLWVATHPDGLTTQQSAQQEPVAIVEVVVPHLESIVVKHILDAPFPKVGDFLYTSPPQPAQQEPVARIHGDEYGDACHWVGGRMPPAGTNLYTAPPAQQEPVARVDYTQRDGFHWLSYLGWQRIPDGALLYTSPQPSKPWVGLTEEETGHWAADFLAGAKWAEAKLREKNA